MAPNEAIILTTNLLQPSQLPEIISLQAFTDLFPRAQRGSPQIRELYRDLQRERRRDAQEVANNIDAEVEAGPALRGSILKAKGAASREEPDEEFEIERALYGTIRDGRHDLLSIVPDLTSTVEDMEKKLENLQAEEARLKESTRQMVDNLSDLRYGRLSSKNLREDMLEGHESFQQNVKRKKT